VATFFTFQSNRQLAARFNISLTTIPKQYCLVEFTRLFREVLEKVSDDERLCHEVWGSARTCAQGHVGGGRRRAQSHDRNVVQAGTDAPALANVHVRVGVTSFHDSSQASTGGRQGGNPCDHPYRGVEKVVPGGVALTLGGVALTLGGVALTPGAGEILGCHRMEETGALGENGQGVHRRRMGGTDDDHAGGAHHVAVTSYHVGHDQREEIEEAF